MSREIGAHPGALVTAQRISALFKPTSVALVGASDTAGSLGDVVRRNLAEGGFAGPVYYVNPRHTEIAGQAAHHGIAGPGPQDGGHDDERQASAS